MAALGQSIRRSAVGLGLFAIFTGGTIAVTQVMTADRIDQQARKAEAAALFEIIPEDRHDNDLLKSTITLPADSLLGTSKPVQAWLAKRSGETTGVILPVVAEEGYSGAIHLLVSIDQTGHILGVRVTQHHETPGLGDKIEVRKTPWITMFTGESLGNPPAQQWKVAKDGGAFDQFTGATITPRAVVKAVKQALMYFSEHRAQLMHATFQTSHRSLDDGDKNQS
ncbi:MAG: electron transport complex subunit RsxG [Marinobacter sp.]|nr:electron transport complex subunit RsxG [Marinobacter sp.]